MLARPWKTIVRNGSIEQAASAIAAEIDGLIAAGEGVDAVVIGYPRRLSGERNEQTLAVEGVVACLRAKLSMPIVLQDERLTSREAESRLALREKDWRKRKHVLDAETAAIILQDYLDSSPRAISEGEDT